MLSDARLIGLLPIVLMQSRPKVFVGELFGGFGARPVRNTAVPT